MEQVKAATWRWILDTCLRSVDTLSPPYACSSSPEIYAAMAMSCMTSAVAVLQSFLVHISI